MNSNNRTTHVLPTVYRSLPVTASVQAARTGSPIEKPSVEAAVRPKPDFPYPVAPLSSFLASSNTLWKNELDLQSFKERLFTLCSTVELKQDDSRCEFHCSAEAKDGNEVVSFVVSIWSVPENDLNIQEKILLQIDRVSGCPYFFRQLTAQFAGKSTSEESCCKKKLFRCPKLPESFNDQGDGIKKECVETALNLATSDIYEQRVQGAMVLADLCNQNQEGFLQRFKEAHGMERLSTLRQDSDCFIRKALGRIIASCS